MRLSVDSGLGVPPVSIHASVKDATGYYIDTFFDMDVSIHASVKDATLATLQSLFGSVFQSTHL